jgi:hypothetical protein
MHVKTKNEVGGTSQDVPSYSFYLLASVKKEKIIKRTFDMTTNNTLTTAQIATLPLEQVLKLAAKGDKRAQRIIRFGLIADCNKKELTEQDRLMEEVWG